jgi:transcriptional regulator with XRE-family HTH domain
MFGRVGIALRVLRELSGTSQAALAQKAKIGKSQLSKYENGRELPKLDSLEKLLEALNVRPMVLFYLTDFLDHIGTEDHILERVLLTAESGALIGKGEQEAFAKIIMEVMGLFGAQLETRMRSALQINKTSRRQVATTLPAPNEDSQS